MLSQLNLIRLLPLVVAIVLSMSVFYYAEQAVSSSNSLNFTLRVGYPDSLDESDVQDLYAFQILASEGIHVIPTYYDSPPFAYDALVAGQQDVIYDESGGSFGLTGNQQQTTCVGGYMLSGTFLAIAGDGITSPSQLVGKTSEDFGPGTIMRYLNEYWLREANISFNTNAPNSNSVFLKDGGENYERVHDLESGVQLKLSLTTLSFRISKVHPSITRPMVVLFMCYSTRRTTILTLVMPLGMTG